MKGAALYRHQGVPVDTLLASAAEALALRGVDACPRGCTCDETTRCGKVYGTGEPLSCFSAVAPTPATLRRGFLPALGLRPDAKPISELNIS